MLTYLSLSCPNIESLICLWMTCLLYDCSCPEQYFCCQALIQNCLLAGIVFVTRQHQPHKQLCQRITGNCCHFSFSRFKILSNCFLFFFLLFFLKYSCPCFITLSPAYFFSWDQHNSHSCFTSQSPCRFMKLFLIMIRAKSQGDTNQPLRPHVLVNSYNTASQGKYCTIQTQDI